MALQQEVAPRFGAGDYVKFFGAGALAATLTHGVSPARKPKRKGEKEHSLY